MSEICDSCESYLGNFKCSEEWKCKAIIGRNAGCKGYVRKEENHKLTMRQHFAFEMFKLVWNDETKSPTVFNKNSTIYQQAVRHADELIKTLNEAKNETP